MSDQNADTVQAAVDAAVAAALKADRERTRRLAIQYRARYWHPGQSLGDPGWPFTELLP